MHVVTPLRGGIVETLRALPCVVAGVGPTHLIISFRLQLFVSMTYTYQLPQLQQILYFFLPSFLPICLSSVADAFLFLSAFFARLVN